MTKSIFVFIASVFLILPLVLSSGEIPISLQLLVTTPFILLLGIPHGAIDNVLYLRNSEIKNSYFIAIYLLFVAINVALWIFFPTVAFATFLILSAYHFGQSQFLHYFNKQAFSYGFLYLLWGIFILTGLVYLNYSEVQTIMAQYPEFNAFGYFQEELFLRYLFWITGGATVVLMLILTVQKKLPTEAFFMEALVLCLIVGCFYLMPLLIGFTLYFVILHSLKVLREEYQFLKTEGEASSVINFIKTVAPFTLLSIAGIAFLFGIIYWDILQISYGYCLLIVISSITLPHVFVMNRFYQLLFSKNFFR